MLLQGALFYSRKCEDRKLSETDRKIKGVEYFVLARDPEIDPKQPENLPVEKRRTPRVDGSRIRSASSETVGSEKRPAIAFTFSPEGGDLFGNLTRKNIPSGGLEESQLRRHLAIILDGLIISAPTINSEIRQGGLITGSFTKKEAENLVNMLRSGALPARLKPEPVSATVEPVKK
jgi:preprotein translocase subunit SecD